MSKGQKIRRQAKRIVKEFLEFYVLCWQKNKKLTFVLTFFFVIASYDEGREFLRGHGTFYDAVALLGKFYKLLFN